ncbi:MAG: glycerol kinase, partial [Betaproteobacteria bacterium HGW-Betaproteobacteria-21]
WDPNARGTLFGLSRGTGAAHIARAALEAIALQTLDLVDAMQLDGASPLHELRVDGGAAANNLLMQLQADLLGVPVVRPRMLETTTLGAAYLAGLGVGVWPDTAALSSQWEVDRVFEPTLGEDQRLSRRATWARALACVRDWGSA